MNSEIPFNRPTPVANEMRYLQEAIEREQLSGDGHFTKLCNLEIERLSQSEKALLTHSCTAALEMAAILCDLKHGDEVIMPSFTFVSTANAVCLRGATPVFVDIDPLTLNLDPDLVAAAVTARTKAIFVVHYGGIMADMERLCAIAKDNDLILVEDAAQALGSTYNGRPAGSFGDMAAFSFHATKNIISGEGGAITINRPDLMERAEIIREKGTNRSGFLRGQTDKYTWVDIGSSFLPGELTAAFLYAQLEMAEVIKKRRMALFNRYSEAMAGLVKQGHVTVPIVPENRGCNGHLVYCMMNDIEDRTAFINHMKAYNIATPFHYVPLHSSPAGKKLGRVAGDMCVSDRTAAGLVRLPLFFALEGEIEAVIEKTLEYFG